MFAIQNHGNGVGGMQVSSWPNCPLRLSLSPCYCLLLAGIASWWPLFTSDYAVITASYNTVLDCGTNLCGAFHLLPVSVWDWNFKGLLLCEAFFVLQVQPSFFFFISGVIIWCGWKLGSGTYSSESTDTLCGLVLVRVLVGPSLWKPDHQLSWGRGLRWGYYLYISACPLCLLPYIELFICECIYIVPPHWYFPTLPIDTNAL